MAWCNRCQSEYEDFIKICAECGEELTEELLIKKKSDEVNSYTSDEKPEFQRYMKLKNCKDNSEAYILISLLELNNIRSMVSYESSGSYLNILHGFNYQGVEVSVPIDNFEEAKGIIETMNPQEVDIDIDLENYEKKFKKKKRILSQLIVSLVLIPLGLITIIGIIEILK